MAWALFRRSLLTASSAVKSSSDVCQLRCCRWRHFCGSVITLGPKEVPFRSSTRSWRHLKRITQSHYRQSPPPLPIATTPFQLAKGKDLSWVEGWNFPLHINNKGDLHSTLNYWPITLPFVPSKTHAIIVVLVPSVASSRASSTTGWFHIRVLQYGLVIDLLPPNVSPAIEFCLFLFAAFAYLKTVLTFDFFHKSILWLLFQGIDVPPSTPSLSRTCTPTPLAEYVLKAVCWTPFRWCPNFVKVILPPQTFSTLTFTSGSTMRSLVANYYSQNPGSQTAIMLTMLRTYPIHRYFLTIVDALEILRQTSISVHSVLHHSVLLGLSVEDRSTVRSYKIFRYRSFRVWLA